VLLRFARDAANAAARQPVPRYYLCGERENLLTAKRPITFVALAHWSVGWGVKALLQHSLTTYLVREMESPLHPSFRGYSFVGLGCRGCGCALWEQV
jgi:hypothetical protein